MLDPANYIKRKIKEEQGILGEGFKMNLVIEYERKVKELSKYGGAAQQMAINRIAQQYAVIREHVVQALVEANIIKLPDPEKTNTPKP